MWSLMQVGVGLLEVKGEASAPSVEIPKNKPKVARFLNR